MGDYRQGFIDGSKEQSQQFQKMIDKLEAKRKYWETKYKELLKEVKGEKE
jgi:hypothetical protein